MVSFAQHQNITNALTVVSASPSELDFSATNQNVLISGANFVSVGPEISTVSVSGTDLTVNNTTIDSTTQITLDVTVTGSTPSSVNVTVTNPDGQSVSAAGLLTIASVTNSSPQITSITPSGVTVGTTSEVTIEGSDFQSGATVEVCSPGACDGNNLNDDVAISSVFFREFISNYSYSECEWRLSRSERFKSYQSGQWDHNKFIPV